jgi:hypothetical protein
MITLKGGGAFWLQGNPDRANDPHSHFCFAVAALQSVDGGEQHVIRDSSGVFEPPGIEVPYISKSIEDNIMPTYGA